MLVEILRLGHRLPRDERISTHVALVARAFGADSVVYSGQHDLGLEESVKRICDNWGGKVSGGQFRIAYEKNFLRVIKERKRDGFSVLHLTMYGLPIDDVIQDARNCGKLLVIVGSEQVPGTVYPLADFNVSITSQPHSEVAALAITLDRLMEGKELGLRDFGGNIRIQPSARGKAVIGKK